MGERTADGSHRLHRQVADGGRQVALDPARGLGVALARDRFRRRDLGNVEPRVPLEQADERLAHSAGGARMATGMRGREVVHDTSSARTRRSYEIDGRAEFIHIDELVGRVGHVNGTRPNSSGVPSA